MVMMLNGIALKRRSHKNALEKRAAQWTLQNAGTAKHALDKALHGHTFGPQFRHARIEEDKGDTPVLQKRAVNELPVPQFPKDIAEVAHTICHRMEEQIVDLPVL